MVEVPSTPPTAEGSLAKTPFPHLLVYIADRALTGSLVLRSGALEQVVHFDEGAPAKVKTGEPVAYLGRVLLEMGLLDEDGLDASLQSLAESGGLHGELLLRAGRIDRVALVAGLREQIVRKMAYLFALPPETTYAFYAETNLLERYGGADATPVDPLRLVFAAARATADAAVVDAMLARLGGAVLRLHTNAEISRFGFDAAELAAVDLLRVRPSSLADLVAADVAPERVVRLVVYTLAITRHLEWGAHGAPPVCADRPAELYRAVRSARAGASGDGQTAVARVRLKSRVVAVDAAAQSATVPSVPGSAPSSPRVPSAAASSDAAQTSARREAIRARAAGIDREDYFTMLGVPRDAADDAVRAAYYALAKQWHPDRLPAELADVRDAASRVFARFNEAFETLSDEGRRKKYLDMVRGGGGTPEEAAQIQQILGAATDYQRAEVFLKKRDFASADEHAKRAMDADPDQGDYVALYALVQLQKHEGQADASFVDLAKRLDAAVEKNPRCERAFFARAIVRKRIGRNEGAIADFRKVVELNPKNIDAARELRVHAMRQGGAAKSSAPTTSAEAKKEPGLFGKLFKR